MRIGIGIGLQYGWLQTLANIEVHFGHMLDDLGNHLCDENGNRFKLYE
jgi:hypothetical protein